MCLKFANLECREVNVNLLECSNATLSTLSFVGVVRALLFAIATVTRINALAIAASELISTTSVYNMMCDIYVTNVNNKKGSVLFSNISTTFNIKYGARNKT